MVVFPLSIWVFEVVFCGIFQVRWIHWNSKKLHMFSEKCPQDLIEHSISNCPCLTKSQKLWISNFTYLDVAWTLWFANRYIFGIPASNVVMIHQSGNWNQMSSNPNSRTPLHPWGFKSPLGASFSLSHGYHISTLDLVVGKNPGPLPKPTWLDIRNKRKGHSGENPLDQKHSRFVYPGICWWNRLPKTNSSPLKMVVSYRNLIFKVSIFRGSVCFREGKPFLKFVVFSNYSFNGLREKHQ